MHHKQTCRLVSPEPLHSMLQSIYFLFAVPVWPDQSLIHSPEKTISKCFNLLINMFLS